MKPFFIVNPVAGGGKAKEKFEKLASLLRERGVEFGYVTTENENESTRLTEEAYAAGERYIVSVGGDGTLNEVASALCTKDDVILGICPFGTGNDFARVLRLPDEPEEMVKILLDGSPKRIDVGSANGKPFVNVGGMGFDVDVVINTERYKDRFQGMIPYLFGIFHSMLHLNRVPVKVTADGEVIEEKILILAVANGSHFGGGMHVAPEADASDGLFDVCMIKAVGFLKFITLLPSFIKGKHLGKAPVRYFKAKEVSIECDRAPIQLDGELGEYAPVVFKVLPGALDIMLPAE